VANILTGNNGPVQQRVSLITRGVFDLERGRSFCEKLGWRSGELPGQDVVFFPAGGTVPALWERSKQAGGGWGAVTLALNLGSPAKVDGVIAEVRAAGAEISRKPAASTWEGFSAVFVDPEDHPGGMAHNPHWTITKDGCINHG
jgi:uncharacterized protein